MRLVVEIDDNLYTRLFDNGDEYVADMRRACVAIRKGKPLPKGHGDLKDCNNLRYAFVKRSMAVQGCFTDADIASIVCSSPTIIEADKAESEHCNG